MKSFLAQLNAFLAVALVASSAAILLIVISPTPAYADSWWLWTYYDATCDQRPEIDQQCWLDGCSANTHGEFYWQPGGYCECWAHDTWGCY